MSVSRKIFLIALSFALPIAVLVYLTVTNINTSITFAEWELKGDKYQRPLEDLLREIQGAQILYNTSATTPVAENAARIHSAFQRLEEADRQLGVDLQFTHEGLAKRHREHQRVATVHQEWQDLSAALSAAGASTTRADLNSKFDHLVADLRTMITHMGDTSNLILDPDLDSYYLMDVTLLALPQTQDRLAQAIQYGYRALRHGKPAEEEKIQLAVYAAMLQEADLDRIAGSSRTSVNEDANFYGTSPSLQNNLPSALALYEKTNAPFLAILHRLVQGSGGPVSADQFLRSGWAAREASFSYWHTAVDEEDALLQLRIDHFTHRRTVSLLLAFLALLAAGMLAYFLTRSITGPLLGLVGSLGPGATLLAVCVERISEASKNRFADPAEAELICQELDANCDAMRKAVSGLEQQVKGAHR